MQYVCYNCFHYIQEEGQCPLCGYDPQSSIGKYRVALKPGTPLANRYVIGRVLGQGGFGVTYVALDSQTQSRVATKEYLPMELAIRDPETSTLYLNSEEQKEDFEFGKQRFLEEARTLMEFVGNEHIVRIHNQFEENGTAYFSMEYVEGIDLKNFLLQRGTPLPVHEANRILLPIMEALQWVHSKGIIHRDISPDNIMITKGGSAKLIDFGAARYSTGEKSKSLDVVLKHGYAPVEQYSRRGRQGPFTDVYSLAATYYYAITGKVPQDAVDRMSEDELIPPSEHGARIRESTEQVLLKALAVNAPDRYPTMNAFYSALLETMPRPYEPEAGEEKDGKRKEKASAQVKIQNGSTQPAGKKKPVIGIIATLVVVALLGAVFGSGVLNKPKTVTEEKENAVKTEPEQEEDTAATQQEVKPEPKKEEGTVEETVPPGDFKTVGGVVTFGTYEQDNNAANGKEPVEWIVLDVQDGRSLLLSRYALACRPYHETYTSEVTWESCSLRNWLNSTFADDAFTAEEQDLIPEVLVSADPNPNYDADPGNDTRDRLFLLSIPEAEKYFAGDASRQCRPTEYVKAAGSFVDEEKGTSWWWLRSPGNGSGSAAGVSGDGSVRWPGQLAGYDKYVVRPALWVDTSSIDIKTVGHTVAFGEYEQDDDLTNGKETIEWVVLSVEEGKSLLISRYALDCQQYNSVFSDVTWEDCSLRKWLNDTFIREAFSSEEQKRIPIVTIKADYNPDYDTNPGRDTQDRVFLLSITEAQEYHTAVEFKNCRATSFARGQGCYAVQNESCYWWLRSPGYSSDKAATISPDGHINSYGNSVGGDVSATVDGRDVGKNYVAVRPALWIIWDS